MSEADLKLVDAMLRGERAAFEAFFAEYYPKIFRFAQRRLGGDTQSAEDVAQESICRAIQSLHTYRGEAVLFTWLCTICRRELSTRHHDVPARAPLSEDDPLVRAALESLLGHGSSSDPVAVTSAGELRAAVLTALDYLPAPYGDILEWKYVREMSVNAIAAHIGRSPKATESLLTRAREAFREAFSELHPERSFEASELTP